MPKPLKAYLAAVVAIGAFALVAATLTFPAKSDIALHVPGLGSQVSGDVEILLGVAFWTVLTLLGSAFPVQLPRGSHHAVAIAPIMASLFLGGPAVAGWVA